MVIISFSLQLEMYATDVEGDLSNYQENGEFKLESFTAKKTCTIYSCCPVPIPDITYTIVLRRRPMFYVFNLILPCVLINGIGKSTFMITNIFLILSSQIKASSSYV